MKPPRHDTFISNTKVIETETIEEKILLIQSGDENLRNELIHSYKPFIKKVLSKVCKRYIDPAMDEYSIGLFAFNEAINQYQVDQGSKFLTFADMVIQRRIIDYIRKESRRKNMIYLDQDELDEEGNQEESFIQQKAAVAHFEKKQEIDERIYQIESYQKLLSEYGITFKVLSKNCPKHVDARDNAKNIAKQIADDPLLSEHLKEKRQLPIKDLLDFVNCSRKTIERNRKYIIAVALIYIGGFTALKSYIEPEN